jgi:hypothetical protein
MRPRRRARLAVSVLVAGCGGGGGGNPGARGRRGRLRIDAGALAHRRTVWRFLRGVGRNRGGQSKPKQLDCDGRHLLGDVRDRSHPGGMQARARRAARIVCESYRRGTVPKSVGPSTVRTNSSDQRSSARPAHAETGGDGPAYVAGHLVMMPSGTTSTTPSGSSRPFTTTSTPTRSKSGTEPV